MTTNAIIIFIVFNVLNVVIQTIKSIATIKCGKTMAAVVNAVAYGLYTYIVVLTASDGVSLWFKIAVVALANLVGVYFVKLFEEKGRKDKLWKIEATFAYRENFLYNLNVWATKHKISYNHITIDKHYIVNFYAPTQKESALVKEFVKKYNGKYFASETKIL
jgi:hypothetical protein